MRDAKNKLRFVILALVTAIVGISAFYPGRAQVLRVDRSEPIVPTIGRVDRHQAGKFFLEKADSLISRRDVEYQILSGNVEFRKGDMLMFCDSAHFYDLRNEIQAFGNVRMEQGDTLFVYADELEYNDSTQLAVLYADAGKNVRLINKEVELKTPIFYYDLGIDLGYYQNGGVLTDRQNRLSSVYGEYAPNTADALFRDNVDLTSIGKNDTLRIISQELLYNTKTHIANIDMPAEIFSKNGTIITDSAVYNTDTEYAELYRRSTVITSTNRSITADSLVYDRMKGFGNAYGNMVLTDSVGKMVLLGDYGFYNELTDSALVTGKALAKEYSQGDTLFLHSDTIRAFRRLVFPEIKRQGRRMHGDSIESEQDSVAQPLISQIPDTVRYVIAAHKVKFFRTDMQGICDSLTFLSSDSTIYLNRHPVVWSESRQIFGNEIRLHLNDSTIETAYLPDFGFMAEEIEPGFYQQLTGKEMLAHFTDGELTRLDVTGNVLGITFPEESDSTINKLGNIETSELRIFFEKRNIKQLKAWPSTKLVLIPLYLAKRSDLYLEAFKWYDNLRPTSAADVMIISKELAEFLDSPIVQSARDKARSRTNSASQIAAPDSVLKEENETAENETTEQ